MSDITIPPEALRAARAASMNARGDGEDPIEAACIAMLKAWSGMKLNPLWELRTHKRSVEMILPVSEPPKMDRKAAVAERLFGDD